MRSTSVRFVLSSLTAVLLAIKQKSHIRQLINGGCCRTAGGQGRTTLPHDIPTDAGSLSLLSDADILTAGSLSL